MVEGARLESVYTLTRIEGSNPSLSAKQVHYAIDYNGFFMGISILIYGSIYGYVLKMAELKR